jgi:hypothetical protein
LYAPPDPALAQDACLDEYLIRLFLPWRQTGGGMIAASADTSPENRAWLAARHGVTVLFELPRAEILDLLAARFGPALLDDAIHGLARRQPELSAHRVITRRQAIIFALLGAGMAAALILSPLLVIRILVALMSVAFFVSAIFRGWLAWLGTDAPARPSPTRDDDASLPLYTIMVPLYREANVLPRLAEALLALDYPQDRLDIKLVVEADDRETCDAAHRAAANAAAFQVVEVPPAFPRTKPKAANYSLRFARGEFLVIYDAEDRPEPDQLRKAVAAFRAAPRRTACLQARLNFYNIDGWLTNGIRAQTPQAI